MSSIRSETRGDVAWVTIDNPEKRNALSLKDLEALSAALDEAASIDDLRALVLTGAGDRVFSGGVDLDDVSGDGAWELNPLTTLCDKLDRFPRPTVARMNGKVRGGAVELTLACDFRVGADDIDLWAPPARIGVHYEPGGLRRAMACMGPQITRRIYLLAETFDAQALHGAGYLDRMVARDDLDGALEDLIQSIRLGAPLAVDGMKTTISELSADRLDANAARDRVNASWASDDLKEGLSAIREKREPRFHGR